MKKIAVYPGSFDPITLGHLNIIKRSTLEICDHLVVAVAANSGKSAVFTLDERVAMIKEEIKEMPSSVTTHIEVEAFEGLLIEFMKRKNASLIIRGLRAVSDFEHEFQLASMNKRMNTQIDTVFLMASEGHHFIASKLVKEIASLGGDVTHFVGKNIKKELDNKFPRKTPQI